MTEPAPLLLEGVGACVFDAYGTLFDFASAAARCDDVPAEKRVGLTALWRDKQLQYTWLRSLQDRYADFWQVTGDALDFALETLGLEAPGLRQRLMDLYLGLEPFPEVPEVLATLRARGFRTAILSNGSPAMLETLVRRSGLARPVRRRPVGRRGRRLQDPSEGLSARARCARSCRRRRSRSSRPTPGTPTRRRTSACASSGATATASAASACRARRICEVRTLAELPGAAGGSVVDANCAGFAESGRRAVDRPSSAKRRTPAFTTSPYMAAPRPRSSRPSVPA